MSLEKVLTEFDEDRDFVCDLLFTIKQEVHNFHARLERMIERSATDKMTVEEGLRIAHILKSTAMTLHLHHEAEQAAMFEREAQTSVQQSSMSMDSLLRLAGVVKQVGAVAECYFEKLEQS